MNKINGVKFKKYEKLNRYICSKEGQETNQLCSCCNEAGHLQAEKELFSVWNADVMCRKSNPMTGSPF
jgi:hypothetical protein